MRQKMLQDNFCLATICRSPDGIHSKSKWFYSCRLRALHTVLLEGVNRSKIVALYKIPYISQKIRMCSRRLIASLLRSAIRDTSTFPMLFTTLNSGLKPCADKTLHLLNRQEIQRTIKRTEEFTCKNHLVPESYQSF